MRSAAAGGQRCAFAALAFFTGSSRLVNRARLFPAGRRRGTPFMSVSVKIFLSTVSDEFRAYRDQLRSDLTRPNVEVKVQEDFKDSGTGTLDNLDRYIASCDAVVHLVGDMTGAEANSASVQTIRSEYPDLRDKLPPLGTALDEGAGISY